MGKKALKYLIILLIIPLIISIFIAIYSDQNGKAPKNDFDSMSGVNYNEINYTYDEQIKRTNTFVYISVGTLVALGFGIWAYTKKKGEF